jgi:parallel beta-helix repeat protein
MKIAFFPKSTAGLFAVVLLVNCAGGAKVPLNEDGSRTFYVSKSGGVFNSGTEDRPLKNINKAVSLAKPGDTVIVMPGVYDEQVIINKDGAPDKWITFRAHPNYMAKDMSRKYGFDAKEQYGVVVNGGGWGSSGFDVRASYVRVQGFFITCPPIGGDQRYDCAVALRNSSDNNFGGRPKGRPYHHIEICDNVVYNGGQAGIAGGGNDFVYVRNNIIFQNASAGVWMGSGISIGFVNNPLLPLNPDDKEFHYIVEGNICYGNSNYDIGRRKYKGEPNLPWDIKGSSDGNGIIIDWAGNIAESRSLIRNNIVYNNGQRGICLTYSSNAVVVNNTLYDNAWDPYYVSSYGRQGEIADVGGNANDPSYPFSGQCGGDRNIFVNNIFYSRTNDRYRGDSPLSNIKVYSDYNFYANGNGFGSSPSLLDNRVNYINYGDRELDPMFVNPPALIKESGRFQDPDDNKIHPVDPIHWYNTDFSLREGSPAVNAGYNVSSMFNRTPGMTDAMAAELKYFLDKALPEYDIFGSKRDPEKMEPGAVAYTKNGT